MLQGELFRGNCLEGKSLGDNFPGEVSSGVILCEREVWGIIFLGGFHGGNVLRGSFPRGNYSGVIVWGVIVLGEFHGGVIV